MNTQSVKKLILIGAGNRGKRYTDIAKEIDGKFEVVAVAEPIAERRAVMQRIHDLPDSACFDSWEPLLEKEKFADAVIIATMDRDHFAPAMAAIEKGYDLLLEKPISDDRDEIELLMSTQKKTGRKVVVCHELRYGKGYLKL